MINFNNLPSAQPSQERLDNIERASYPRNSAQLAGQKTLEQLRAMQAQYDMANANADSALKKLNDSVADKISQMSGAEPSRRGLFRRR